MAAPEVIHFPFRAQLGSRFLASATFSPPPLAKFHIQAKNKSSRTAFHNRLNLLVNLPSERVSAWHGRGGAAETHLGTAKNRSQRRCR